MPCSRPFPRSRPCSKTRDAVVPRLGTGAAARAGCPGAGQVHRRHRPLPRVARGAARRLDEGGHGWVWRARQGEAPRIGFGAAGAGRGPRPASGAGGGSGDTHPLAPWQGRARRPRQAPNSTAFPPAACPGACLDGAAAPPRPAPTLPPAQPARSTSPRARRRSCGAARWSRCRGGRAPLCTTTFCRMRSAST